MSAILHTDPCGCRVVRDDTGCGVHIERCALHEAAEAMHLALLDDDALHSHIAECASFDTPDGTCPVCLELASLARTSRRVALSRARGEADQ